MLQLTRRYLRQIDGIFLALCAACSVLSVVTLVSIGHNQLGSINKASVQFIASALGILLALIVSTVDYRALARAWPLHAVLAWGMVLPTLLLHNVRLGFLTVGYDAGGTSNYSWYRVGGMTFQPAELAKISFVLTLALHLNHVRGRVNKPANLLALAVHVLLPVLARLLPRKIELPAAEGSFLRQFAVLRDSRCWHCVLMVLFSASATYTVYTYLTPTLTGTLGLPETAVSPALLVMGLCSAASNLFSGRLAEKGGLKPLPVFFAAQVLLFAVLPLLLVNRWLGLTGLFAMGLLMYLLNTPVQVHSLGLAEAEYPAAASLCASVQPVSYNFGIAAGSFAGSLVQDAWGPRLLGVPAAVFALLSLWQCRGLLRSIQRRKARR